nr:hypothetical protein GCM10010200_022030 [Actinomadura rugatobispora]
MRVDSTVKVQVESEAPVPEYSRTEEAETQTFTPDSRDAVEVTEMMRLLENREREPSISKW